MKVCKTCGGLERYANGKCKACHRSHSAAFRKANPEKAKEATEKWRSNNREHEKAYAATYRAENRDKRNKYSAEWRSKNPEKAKAAVLTWNLNNPDAKRLFNQNRRALRKKVGGVLSVDLSTKLFRLQRGKCACCGLSLGETFHLDHIMPLALGGANTDDNMQLLRQRCNTQKQAKHPIDFMQSRGFLL